jgi:hypothetical protein
MENDKPFELIFGFFNDGEKYFGCDIYQFGLAGYTYNAEINYRVDETNGGYEIQLLYKTEECEYEQISIKNAFALYNILSQCYLASLYKLIPKVNGEVPHIKLFGGKPGDDGVFVNDERKNKIAIKYIHRVLPIKEVFLDSKGNSILIIDKDKLCQKQYIK